jgi:hypothetical protein
LLGSVAEKVEIGSGKDSMQRKTTWDFTKELLPLFVALAMLVGAGTTGSECIVTTSGIEGTTGTSGTCEHDREWRRDRHRRHERRPEHEHHHEHDRRHERG